MTVLVTGAAGMLGRALTDALLERGIPVRSFDLEAHPDPRVQSVQGDLRDAHAVALACAGVDTVFHTASVVYLGLGRPQWVHDVNVQGTQHVLDGCRAQGVPRLVYTSSIDVVINGRPIIAGDETLPYSTHPLDFYSETKIEAEQRVLAASGAAGLLTTAIRPPGIFGPFDRHRLPTIIDQVRQGKLTRIGSGDTRYSHVYVGNLAYAHLLAADALRPGGSAAGQAYFITDSPPANFFDFLLPMVEALGYPPVRRSVPAALVTGSAQFNALRYRLSPSETNEMAKVTPYAAHSLTADIWFVSDRAARELGYQPIISLEEARARTVAWFAAQGWAAPGAD